LKEIYEQYEKYQRRFDILSNELRCNGLNHCYGKIFDDNFEWFDDDIKTLSISNKKLSFKDFANHTASMPIIADYVTSKFHNLIYLDISSNFFWLSTENDIEINNLHNLKRILDHPSIIFVNICGLLFEMIDSFLTNDN
jgi:hypothetical protein